MKFLDWLREPDTVGLLLDDPDTTLIHSELIQKKPILKSLYQDFYKQFCNSIDNFESKVLVELGSGGGLIKEIIPNVITSEILKVPNVDRIFSATDMPFESNSVDAFLMIDVLHHITEPRLFFKEANRCLRKEGEIIMIEPANTIWGRFIYKNLHHEMFDVSSDWNLEEVGPLSHGNGAIPWIIFNRDRDIFEKDFPEFNILSIRCHTPFRYLLSGGLSFRQLIPSCTDMFFKFIEFCLSPLNRWIGMFQTIELKKE